MIDSIPWCNPGILFSKDGLPLFELWGPFKIDNFAAAYEQKSYLVIDVSLYRICYTNKQGLIPKEKVDINGEKGAQISIAAKKIVTQGRPEIMIMKYKRAIHYICFFSLHHVHVMLLIWSKNWIYVYYLLLFLISFKFGHTQISVPKVGILMSKTGCINPR